MQNLKQQDYRDETFGKRTGVNFIWSLGGPGIGTIDSMVVGIEPVGPEVGESAN